MKKDPLSNLFQINLFIFFLFISFIVNAQVLQVEVVGGAVVSQGSTMTINAGNSLRFRIKNIEGSNCKKLKIKDVDVDNPTDFDINPNNPKKKHKAHWLLVVLGERHLDFEIENISPSCTTTSTLVTIEIKNQPDFTFTLQVNSAQKYLF